LFTVFAKLILVDQHGADFFKGVDIFAFPILDDLGTEQFSIGSLCYVLINHIDF